MLRLLECDYGRVDQHLLEENYQVERFDTEQVVGCGSRVFTARAGCVAACANCARDHGARHGAENTGKNSAARLPVPLELVSVPRIVVEHLIARIILELRASATGDNHLASVDPLFKFLNSLFDSGSVFLELVISILLDPTFFNAHQILSLDQRVGPQPVPLPGSSLDPLSISTASGHSALIELVEVFTRGLLDTPDSLESSGHLIGRPVVDSHRQANALRAHESSCERERLDRDFEAELSAIQYKRPLEKLIFWLIYLSCHSCSSRSC